MFPPPQWVLNVFLSITFPSQLPALRGKFSFNREMSIQYRPAIHHRTAALLHVLKTNRFGILPLRPLRTVFFVVEDLKVLPERMPFPKRLVVAVVS